MLGKHELALIAALKARPGIQKTTRTVGSLPTVPDDAAAAALPGGRSRPVCHRGVYRIVDDMGVLAFTVGIVVRNVGGNTQAALAMASPSARINF